jgi:hypothetical protein
MAQASTTTTDHDEIRSWAEEHGGQPSRVKATGRGKDPGILRIDFPGFSGEGKLEPITWDRFFQWFDANGLALVYRKQDRFNKLVRRDAAQERRSRGAAGGRSKPRAASKASPRSKTGRSAGTRRAASTGEKAATSRRSKATGRSGGNRRAAGAKSTTSRRSKTGRSGASGSRSAGRGEKQATPRQRSR